MYSLRHDVFQSTRPRGARPGTCGDYQTWLKFQSTRPRGARPYAGPPWAIESPFQSTRPRGARRTIIKVTAVSIQFQSTRPRGARRDRQAERDARCSRFQSTRPRGARRLPRCENRYSLSSFNPRAHEGRDEPVVEHLVVDELVSIHAPTRGATLRHRTSSSSSARFNPRAHEGRDRDNYVTRSEMDEFQSTRPRGARQCPRRWTRGSSSVSIHAPTRGATRESRPQQPPVGVSIHAPTRGATDGTPIIGMRDPKVSIHAPTRGATCSRGR